MNQAKAFAPGNVSCVFKIVPDDDPRKMHSLGMGFTVSEGVTATVARAESTRVRFNGQDMEFPTVRGVAAALTSAPVDVQLTTELPLSGGFGLSGASALATVYAVNELERLGQPESVLGLIAHVAEVENLTGLGDVAGQVHGGCLAKLAPGDPLAAVDLPVPEQTVHYRYFSPILTREIIGDPERRRRINEAADTALVTLGGLREAGESEFSCYITVAKKFAVDSGLLAHEHVRAAIAEAERIGGAASMIMLGNAVFSTVPFSGSTATRLSHRRVGVLP
jgi:pantoate kinase